MSIALLGHLGLNEESAFGVEATPPSAFEKINSENISLADNNLIISRGISGVRGIRKILAGPISGNGGFKLDLTPEDLMGWILKFTFGTPITTTLTPGIYQHVFTPQDSSELPSFTTQVDAEAGCWNWIGCRLSELG